MARKFIYFLSICVFYSQIIYCFYYNKLNYLEKNHTIQFINSKTNDVDIKSDLFIEEKKFEFGTNFPLKKKFGEIILYKSNDQRKKLIEIFPFISFNKINTTMPLFLQLFEKKILKTNLNNDNSCFDYLPFKATIESLIHNLKLIYGNNIENVSAFLNIYWMINYFPSDDRMVQFQCSKLESICNPSTFFVSRHYENSNPDNQNIGECSYLLFKNIFF